MIHLLSGATEPIFNCASFLKWSVKHTVVEKPAVCDSCMHTMNPLIHQEPFPINVSTIMIRMLSTRWHEAGSCNQAETPRNSSTMHILKKMLQNLQIFLMPKQSSFNPIPWTFEEPQYAFSSTQDTRYQADHKEPFIKSCRMAVITFISKLHLSKKSIVKVHTHIHTHTYTHTHPHIPSPQGWNTLSLFPRHKLCFARRATHDSCQVKVYP